MIGRSWRHLAVCACISGAAAFSVPAALGAPLAATALPAPLGAEVEPDDSPARASPLFGDMRVRASLEPAGDVDCYRFEADAGERVFAAIVTAGSLGAAADTRLTLLAGDGATPLETDDNGGSQQERSSSIAGVRIPSDGTYFLRVEDVRGAAAAPAPYDLYLALRAGAAVPEAEPNNEFTAANPLVNGEATGTHQLGADGKDKDWFAINLQAGDSVFLSLDLDPERDGGSFDGALGFGLSGDEDKRVVLTVDDPQPSDPPEASPPSEALTMTVSKGGTYYVNVDVGPKKPDSGGPQATYDLAASVFPAAKPMCRIYSAAAGPLLDGGTTAFPIAVEDAARIARTAVRLDLDESVMADLDASLRSPAGLELPLFHDIGEVAPGGQRNLQAVFDDYAATPPLYNALRPLGLRPDVPLAGFDGQPAQGAWSLLLGDDSANGSAGRVTAAELVVCPEAEASPAAGAKPSASAPSPPARPRLTDLTIAPSRFRAAKSGGKVLAKWPATGGAVVSYTLSVAARTQLTISGAHRGRRVGDRCVPRTRANASRRRCRRYLELASVNRDDSAGSNRFFLSGRVAGQPLPPGRYRLRAKATAAPSLASDPASVGFTVLQPQARRAPAKARP